MHIFFFFFLEWGGGGAGEKMCIMRDVQTVNSVVFVWWQLARKELISPLTGLLFISAE